MTSRLTRACNYLAKAQNEDGGWGYAPDRTSSPEPTIYAALGLGSQPGRYQRAARRALGWLAAQVKPNGALALPGHRDDHWTTMLYLLTLARLDPNPANRAQIQQWVLNYKSSPISNDQENNLNGTLIGWGWAWSTFGWVEPTSYALLALKAGGLTEHERVAEGTRLLLDRHCGDGGWNYGNREVLGQRMTSFIPTTAWAGLALQKEPRAAEMVPQAFQFLNRALESTPSVLNLSLTMLCLNAWNEPVHQLTDELNRRQSDEGDWHQNTYQTALAVLALTAVDGAGGAANVLAI